MRDLLRNSGIKSIKRLCSVVVITPDSDSGDPGSTPGTTSYFCLSLVVWSVYNVSKNGKRSVGIYDTFVLFLQEKRNWRRSLCRIDCVFFWIAVPSLPRQCINSRALKAVFFFHLIVSTSRVVISTFCTFAI
jgi:hypothetical protein